MVTLNHTDDAESLSNTAPAFTPTQGRCLIGVVLLALLLRIAWASAVPVMPVSDCNAYDVFAKSLADGTGYGWEPYEPSAYWPVGMSFIYSVFYRLFGHTYTPIVGFNILVSLTIILLTIWLVRRYVNSDAAVLAGFLLAIWPSQIEFVTVLASELPFTMLMLLSICVWIQRRLNAVVKVLATGTLLAGACYVRPTALLFPFLLAYIMLLQERKALKTILMAGATMAILLILLQPWAARNKRAFGHRVLISTNSGSNLWMGNSAGSAGGWKSLPPEVEDLNEAERDNYLKAEAVAWIRSHPVTFLKLCVKRLIATHARESIGIVWNQEGLASRLSEQSIWVLKLLSNLFWWGVLSLGIVGVVVAIRQDFWAFIANPAILFWGYFAGVHAVIVSQDRYHFPSIPFIVLFAALAIAACMRRYKAIKHGLELN